MASTACVLCSRRPAEENVPCPSPNIVHSSFTPDAACVSQCALDLATVNAAARRCDEEIVFLRDLLISHQSTRKQLHERAVQYRSIMSPIRRLPKELLVQIFTDCILDYSRFERGYAGLVNKPNTLPIFTLLCVCSKWRSVILSTGALWAQFECKLDSAMESNGIGLECLEMYLERSGDVPLSFWVHGETLLPTDTLIRRLLQEKRRWMDVSFVCEEIAMQGWDIPAGSFPCLRRLHIDSTEIIDEAEQGATTLIDFYTQSMRSLDISPRILMHAIFPFDSLTNLVIRHYDSSALVAKCLIEGCNAENLEYLEFWQDRGDDDVDDFDYRSLTTRMTLNIKALTILFSDDGRAVILKLLSTCFRLPRLHAFKLGQIEHLDSATRNAIVAKTKAFLDTVDHLKSLSIHGIFMADADVLQLLQKAPSLEEVSLTFMREGSGPLEVLDKLTATVGAPFVRPVLPLLRGVNFYFENGDNLLITALLNMLCSRLPSSCGAHPDTAELSGVAALENIFIHFSMGSCSHDAARVIRYAASSAYRLRWVDGKTFSLLKAGRKDRWMRAAGPHHSTLF